jgi:hypothetical protein
MCCLPRQRLVQNGLGAKLETEVLAIDDMDAEEWTEDDSYGYTLSRALHQVQRRNPLLPLTLIDKIVTSARFNIATRGIHALQALGDASALKRLIDLYDSESDWHIRDAIANAIELMAARHGVVIRKVDGRYQSAN